MINWQRTAISEPCVMQWVSNAVIENHIKSKMPPQELFPMFPCNMQTVERAV